MSESKLPALSSKQRALARREQQRHLDHQAVAKSAAVFTVWAALAFILGTVMAAGELVHAAWLAIVFVAMFLSPVALIVLRDIRRSHQRARIALGEAEVEAEAPAHLDGALARFHAETRTARLGVGDAVEPGEGVRLLWEWRRSFEALGERERERLEELGVGLGPIAELLSGPESQRSALSEAELRDAAVHLGHVEDLLASPPASFYR